MSVPLIRDHRLPHSRAALLVPVLCCAALGAPTPALAQTCVAPPGNSGIDEYCESIPGPGGDRGAGDRPQGPGISGDTRQALEASGPLGQAVGSLAAEGRPGGGTGREGPEAGAGAQDDGDGGNALSDVGEGNALSAVGASVDSGASSGAALVWILAGATCLAAGAGWLRIRSRAG